MDSNKLNSKISEMVSFQKELNDSTNGQGWESGKTQNNKVINWKRCIYMETAELIDSYPWKHWKNINSGADMENIKTELVDIWHFILSLAIQILPINEVSPLLTKICKKFKFDENKNHQSNSIDDELEPYENLMLVSLSKDRASVKYIEQLTNAFFTCSVHAKLSIDELHTIYIAKNCLNSFRQLQGYKEGTYHKNWNGVEDNVVMHQLINSMPELNRELLIQQLGIEYAKVTK